MLRTLRVVGTKTPENVPSLSEPPTGLGMEPTLSPGTLGSFVPALACVFAVKDVSANCPFLDFPFPLEDRLLGTGTSLFLSKYPGALFVASCRRNGEITELAIASSGLVEGTLCSSGCRSSVVDGTWERCRSICAASSVAVRVESFDFVRGSILLAGALLSARTAFRMERTGVKFA